MPLNIIVCIKQIIDPEIPASQFKIDPTAKRQVQGGHSLVISAYDQNAIEVAIQLKEKHGGKVTAISIGTATAATALKSALSMGADEAVLIDDPAIAASDQQGIAYALAKAGQKIGAFDLILTGCISGDWGDRAVPAMMAEELGIGCVTFVSRIDAKDGRVILRRVVEDGYELVEAGTPVLASIISDDTNTPRYPKLKDIMAAGKKPIPTWKASDLSIDPEGIGSGAARAAIIDVYMPVKESKCEMIEGDTPQEQAVKLAGRLRELKLI
jgi:electron transfer flavoprotein beta subunit